MATLAERMAARRAKLDAEEDDGLYFAGPNSGGPKSLRGASGAMAQQAAPPRSIPRSNGAPAIRPPSQAPPSGGAGGGVSLGDVSLQDDDEDDDEEADEGGGMTEIQKCPSQTLHPATFLAPATSCISPLPSSPSTILPTNTQQRWDPNLNSFLLFCRYQQKLKEESVKAGMAQYQAELRDRDAADAVVGIACGNLDEVKQNTHQ